MRAASQFNAIVKAKFGKPPGRVFDVNIYPRDYNAINESINPDYAVDPIADKDIDQPTGAMQKLSRVDQDVATLLKQRRFLDDASFQALMNSVVDSATAQHGEADHQAVRGRRGHLPADDDREDRSHQGQAGGCRADR